MMTTSQTASAAATINNNNIEINYIKGANMNQPASNTVIINPVSLPSELVSKRELIENAKKGDSSLIRNLKAAERGGP
jgi:predicted regulator of amino acid metabolism with ACT domain